MTAALNIPKMLETALKAALVEAGVNETETYLNFLQVRTDGKARFPQIQGSVASPIADGVQGNGKFSEFRTAKATLRICTLSDDDDPANAAFGALYVQVMTMIETIITAPASWQTSNLTGVVVNAVTIAEGSPLLPEQLPNGGYMMMMEIPIEFNISVT